MKRMVLSAFAVTLLCASVAQADIYIPPPPPPPKPPTKPTKPAVDPTVVAGTIAAVGIVLAGVWLARSRRRATFAS